MNYGKIVGYYFIVLGVLVIIGMILEIVLAGRLFIDVTAIFLIWAGYGLLRNRNSHRIAAIVICCFYVVATMGVLLVVIIRGTSGRVFRYVGGEIRDPSMGLAVLVLAVGLVMFGTPLIALLHPKTREIFKRPSQGEAANTERPTEPALPDHLKDDGCS